MGMYDHRVIEIVIWNRSEDHKRVEPPQILVGQGYTSPDKASLEFSHHEDYIYFSFQTFAGSNPDRFTRYDLKNNLVFPMVNKIGEIRRGTDMKIYLADERSASMYFIDENPCNLFTTGTQAMTSPLFWLSGIMPQQVHKIYSNEITEGIFAREVDKKQYELTDHLGNVRVVVSDRKGAENDPGNPGNLINFADILAYNNYYPFGSLQPGRNYNSPDYRYGFNGKEMDNEWKGTGASYDYGFRIYDPRLGRFLSIDPIARQYPELSPYQFASNRPIDGVDLDGLEYYSVYIMENEKGETRLKIISHRDTEEGYGKEGPGIQYINFKVVDGKRVGKIDVKMITNIYGIYYGERNPTILGEEGADEDYQFKPIDIVDYLSKEHDKKYDLVDASATDVKPDPRTIQYDKDYVEKLKTIRKAYKQGIIDPITKEKISSEADEAAGYAIFYFENVLIPEKEKIAADEKKKEK